MSGKGNAIILGYVYTSMNFNKRIHLNLSSSGNQILGVSNALTARIMKRQMTRLQLEEFISTYYSSEERASSRSKF